MKGTKKMHNILMCLLRCSQDVHQTCDGNGMIYILFMYRDATNLEPHSYVFRQTKILGIPVNMVGETDGT